MQLMERCEIEDAASDAELKTAFKIAGNYRFGGLPVPIAECEAM
jgi:hypothetical protein